MKYTSKCHKEFNFYVNKIFKFLLGLIMHHQELMAMEFKIFISKVRSNFDYVHAINLKHKEVQEHLQFPYCLVENRPFTIVEINYGFHYSKYETSLVIPYCLY